VQSAWAIYDELGALKLRRFAPHLAFADQTSFPDSIRIISLMTRISRVRFLLCWLFEWVLWLVFTDNTGFRELLVGAAVAAIATYFSFVFAHRKKVTSFRMPAGLGVIWQVPAVLARDTAVLLLAVARRLAGRSLPSGYAAIPFAAVGDNPRSRGKRALAATLMTVTPNTLVLGVLKNEKVLFFHRLLPEPPSSLTRRLSAHTRRST
jgi:multisubunit Na+/H+ antiporter MnhE subunit